MNKDDILRESEFSKRYWASASKTVTKRFGSKMGDAGHHARVKAEIKRRYKKRYHPTAVRVKISDQENIRQQREIVRQAKDDHKDTQKALKKADKDFDSVVVGIKRLAKKPADRDMTRLRKAHEELREAREDDREAAQLFKQKKNSLDKMVNKRKAKQGYLTCGKCKKLQQNTSMVRSGRGKLRMCVPCGKSVAKKVPAPKVILLSDSSSSSSDWESESE